ncbi:MAG: hypothetical protein IK070_01225 [Clostridia bacterium]|nr:hypothetical protein [Clostridia bacterium]
MIYTNGKTMSASLLNSKSELSIIGAFQLVQDNVTDLMGELKIDGLSTKKNYNAMWVISKNRVHFKKMPFWNDDVAVESFISNKSLAKLTIDTIVRDENGEECLCARTELCALDIATGKIKKIAQVGVGENIEKHDSAENIQFGHFDNTLSNKLETCEVRSTNIDYLHHCNNIEYLRFILNVYMEKSLHNIKEMEMVYANQSFEGEKLDVYKSSNGNIDHVYLKRGNDFVIKSEIVR